MATKPVSLRTWTRDKGEYYVEEIYYPRTTAQVRYRETFGSEQVDICVNQFTSVKGIKAAREIADEFVAKLLADGYHYNVQFIIQNRDVAIYDVIKQETIIVVQNEQGRSVLDLYVSDRTK